MKAKSMIMQSSILAILLSTLAPASAGTTTPGRVPATQLGQLPYVTSGPIWGNGVRGSGTVARDPYIAVSCAHVVFENGRWLSGFNFANAHNGTSHPSTSSRAMPLRGYWYWTSYTGGNSSSAFAQDYVVHYSSAKLAQGAYAGWMYNDSTSAHPLASTATTKMIVGYPGSDSYYQNSVGGFTSAYRSSNGFYLWNSAVKGGSGMSGGGVFVRQGTSGSDWRLAGVHVSGYTDGSLGAGARAINKNAYDLMTNAIASSGSATPAPTVTKTVSSTSALSIPDNSSTWTVRSLAVSGMPATLVSAKVSLNISHTYRGDLQVTLTSPAGRSITLHNQTGGSEDNLIITNQDVSSTFSGGSANGTWKLSVRDVLGGDVGRLNSVSLTLGAR